MNATSTSRQLAAIMFTDIVGYTALMGSDEQRAFEILEKNRQLQKPIIEDMNGRWIKELGDGVMASFNTVSDAVKAAIRIQDECNTAKEFQLRIGIHLGEVLFDHEDVFGDGVNIASRIQAIARPGGIYVSEPVYNNISNKKDIGTKFIKEESLKNVKEGVRIYEVFTDTPGPGYPPDSAPKGYTPAIAAKPDVKEIPMKSVAVIPFINMSNDPEQEYFSEGMAEEIINSLAHLKDLKVAARTSTFQFKGENVDLKEVGEKLKVKTVLEGSIRKQGSRIRVTTQLINVEDGFHLWSERYDRELDDIFAIQDEIALSITEKLKVSLINGDREQIKKTYTQDTDAYELYLQGRYYWKKRNQEALETSIGYFQKAIDKDPNYALAWAGLADSYNLLDEYGTSRRAETAPKAKAAVSRALQIDDGLGEAHASYASLLLFDDWDWVNAGKEFKKGIDMNPNYATAHHWFAEWLMYTGKFDEALGEISIAADLDPISPAILKDKGMILYYNRQYDKAIQWAKAALELHPNFPAGHRLLYLCYEGKKMFREAITENERWGALTGNAPKTAVFLARLYADSGREEDARKIVEGFSDHEMKVLHDYRALALVYSALGEIDKAFDFLDKSYNAHELAFCTLRIDPKLDPLRSDPRYEELIKRMNFPD
jgi:adenylate cyclase